MNVVEVQRYRAFRDHAVSISLLNHGFARSLLDLVVECWNVSPRCLGCFGTWQEQRNRTLIMHRICLEQSNYWIARAVLSKAMVLYPSRMSLSKKLRMLDGSSDVPPFQPRDNEWESQSHLLY